MNYTNILMSIGALASTIPLTAASDKEEKRPNIIWFLIEDTSTEYLSMFNDGKGAKMPNVESLREDGVMFTNAYSNAPVSSAARTSLISGCYAPRIAGSFHRHLEKVPMPEGYKMIPAYFREAGYHTSNANKMDYNLELDEQAWDNIKSGEYGWRKRDDKDQPFFYMYTTMLTHESKLLFDKKFKAKTTPTQDPSKVDIAPYHPDTELMRYTYATFYDQIGKADDVFGDMIQALKKDNLLDNTIIFFMGDNGGCVPGTKGYTDNIGLHVPLFVYIPEALQSEYDIPVGREDDRNVSFIDLGATSLSLAGIKPPKNIDGKAFLGEYEKSNKRTAMCYGDRFDDLYAFNRVLYKDGLRYARNYQPYHTQGLYAYYRYKSLAFQEWRDLYYKGKLNADQSAFFEPFGTEELYDLEADPHELNNLANDPRYGKQLKAMRKELQNAVVDKCDLGFIPECVTIQQGYDDIVKFGKSRQKDIKRYRSIADLQMVDYSKAESKLRKYISSDDNIDKWWALTTLSYFNDESSDFADVAEALTEADYPSYLRSRALVYSALQNKKLDAPQIKQMLASSTSLAEVLIVLNDLAYIKEIGAMPKMKFEKEKLPFSSYSTDERILFLNK